MKHKSLLILGAGANSTNRRAQATEVAASSAERFFIKVPKVYSDLTTREVLTMEWVEGTRLVDGAELRALTGDPLAPARLVDTLVQCSLRQMLETGFFHADPHAGNLLATADGRLCYLDFGMMSYLEERQRLSIIEAVVHLVNRDFEALAALYQRMGFIGADVDVAPIVKGLQQALPDVLDASVGELNIKNIFGKLGDVMYTFPFQLPPFYIAIIRCLGVLEGVAIQVDPGFRIVSDAYPYIASRLLTDDAPELRRALVRLLFKDDQPQWTRFEALLDRARAANDYDASQAVELLVTILASDDAAAIRANLVADLADALDYVGVETARNIVKQTLGVDLPKPPPFFAANARTATVTVTASDDGDDTFDVFDDASPAARLLLRLADSLQSRGGAALLDLETVAEVVDDIQRYAPLAKRVLDNPVLRRTATEILAASSERAASRAIRLALYTAS